MAALVERHPGITLHCVGRLQSNKAAEAVRLFDVIHSLDRPSLLAALAAEGEKQDRRPSVYVQVNIGEEEQKGGCAIGGVGELVAAVRASPLPLAGLMAIPPLGVEPAPFFALLAELARRHDVSGLSMGMSADYRAAVMLGATAVARRHCNVRGLSGRADPRFRRRAARQRICRQPPSRRAADRTRPPDWRSRTP